MTSADDDIITLSVPVGVASLYLVPTSAPPADPRQAAMTVIPTLPDRLRRTVEVMFGDDWLTVELVPAPDDPLLQQALKLFDATPAQLAAFDAATHLIRVRAIGKPWREPYHEYAARAVAAGLAAHVGADVIDLFTPRVLTVAQAEQTLPHADEPPPLADWVTVLHWRDDRGRRSTTRGLRRYGLPELLTPGAPPSLTAQWTQALLGIASRLVDEWEAALLLDDRPSFVEIPAEFLVRERDIARAENRSPRGDGSTRIRLQLELPDGPEADSVLTIVAPLESASTGSTSTDSASTGSASTGSAADFVAEVCAALLG